MARGPEWQKRTASPEHVDAKTSQHGWFLPYLIEAEAKINGRWPYWLDILENQTIGQAKIPQLRFDMVCGGRREIPYGEDVARNHMLGYCGSPGEAQANIEWAFRQAFDRGVYLLDLIEWWLFAFGSPRVKVMPKLEPKAAHAMYCGVELQRLIANPADWAAHIATLFYGEKGHKQCAWFPTPMSVCELNVRMMFDPGEDHRTKTVMDPCAGTGAMLLPASNYSLRLFAATGNSARKTIQNNHDSEQNLPDALLHRR